MKSFHLTIAKVGENIYDGEALRAVLPGADGQFEVLARHEALVSELKAGLIKVQSVEDVATEFSIGEGGIAEISNNQATVLL